MLSCTSYDSYQLWVARRRQRCSGTFSPVRRRRRCVRCRRCPPAVPAPGGTNSRGRGRTHLNSTIDLKLPLAFFSHWTVGTHRNILLHCSLFRQNPLHFFKETPYLYLLGRHILFTYISKFFLT